MQAKRAAIVGVGTSRIGEIPGSTSLGLMADAAAAAVADAGLRPRDIDGVIVRGPDDEYCFHQLLGERLGLNPAFATSLDNGGASQALSVVLAALAINAGLATTALCGYARNAWSRTRLPGTRKAKMSQAAAGERPREFRDPFGYFGEAATHALGARRHMALYGTTKEQLGAIALAFREHATRNPEAQMREPLTMEQYLKARLIADPFGLFDCSLVTDGAGAVIVTSAERARSLKKRPVYIMGIGQGHPAWDLPYRENWTTTGAAISGPMAFQMAGISHADVDVVEFYDCFTIVPILTLEDYGFVKKGEGAAFVEGGTRIDFGGELPMNTSGGLNSETGMPGMQLIAEGVRQLRGECGPRQVEGAEIAVVSNQGGILTTHATLVLRR